MTKPINAKYVVSSKEDVMLPEDVNTDSGRYPVLSYIATRKFKTRAAARVYKQARKYPQHYAIVNTEAQMVVR